MTDRDNQKIAYIDNALKFVMHNMPNKYRDVVDYNAYAYAKLIDLDRAGTDLAAIDVPARAIAFWEEAKKKFEAEYAVKTGNEQYFDEYVKYYTERQPNCLMISCEFRDGSLIKRFTAEISRIRVTSEANKQTVSVTLPHDTGLMNKSLMAAFESENYTFSLTRDIGAIGSAERFTLGLLDRELKTYTTL
jgi:hypothetical protein